MTAPSGGETVSERRPRRGVAVLVMVTIVALVAGAVGWAASTIMRPPEDSLDATTFTTVAVEPGEVGSSVDLNVVAEWVSVPVGFNQASGIVTAVTVAAGDEVTQGNTLYLVNQRPVTIAEGIVPAFRQIGAGATGNDVRQLQVMLQALGFFTAQPDGQAGPLTVSAVRAWQKSIGVEQSGNVEIGDVIFVPVLPTRVSLDTEVIARGSGVSGGESVVRALPAAPEFTVPVTDAQSAMIPSGTLVQITSPEGGVWDAVAGDRTTDAESQTTLVALVGVDGAQVCTDQCGQVAVTGKALLPSKITTSPTVEGLVVPSSALLTDATGRVAVVDAEGAVIAVTLVASARGMSVIEGVDAGTKVRVPATEDATR